MGTLEINFGAIAVICLGSFLVATILGVGWLARLRKNIEEDFRRQLLEHASLTVRCDKCGCLVDRYMATANRRLEERKHLDCEVPDYAYDIKSTGFRIDGLLAFDFKTAGVITEHYCKACAPNVEEKKNKEDK